MKGRLGILSGLTLIAFVLSCSFASADFWGDLAKELLKNSTKTDTQEKEGTLKTDAQKNSEEFDKKFKDLLKKLPAEAKVLVLEVKVKVPEIETPESDPDVEDIRKKMIKGLQSIGEQTQDMLEEELGKSGITIVDRDAFKDIEKEIVYSQTGEVDQSSSAKFGKAVGATHLLITKILINGFITKQLTTTLSVKITEVESATRIGSIFFTQKLEQPKESTDTTTTSQRIQKHTLADETFYVNPGRAKIYSYDFPLSGSLDISLTANSDIFLYVVDNENYEAYDAGRGFRSFARKERITSANFSVSVPKGKHYIVISNEHSLLTTAGISLSASYTSK